MKELQTVYVPTGHKKWEEKFKVHTTDKSQPQFANEKSGYFFTPEELEKFKAELQREKSKERFIMPTDSQIVKTAIVFNDGKINETELSNMVAMADFIINRLYENGDISIPASNENETPITK